MPYPLRINCYQLNSSGISRRLLLIPQMVQILARFPSIWISYEARRAGHPLVGIVSRPVRRVGHFAGKAVSEVAVMSRHLLTNREIDASAVSKILLITFQSPTIPTKLTMNFLCVC